MALLRTARLAVSFDRAMEAAIAGIQENSPKQEEKRSWVLRPGVGGAQAAHTRTARQVPLCEAERGSWRPPGSFLLPLWQMPTHFMA